MSVKLEQHHTIPNVVKFSFGGLSGMCATCVVQPLDLVKTRMQLTGDGATAVRKTSFQTILAIVRSEGPFALYDGLSAALVRQATYTTTRMGVYQWLFESCRSSKGEAPNFYKKAVIGMSAGACGAFIGTPAELALIRMTSDGRLPPEQRRHYKNVFDALIRVYKEEGLLAMWRGCGPTIGRAMVVNGVQLSTYSQVKQALLESGWFSDNLWLQFVASMISGLATTTASMPVDICKTRIQNMRIIDGRPEYRGALDVLGRVVRHEGLFSLWKGFTPYYARLGPHTVLTFIVLEQLNRLYCIHVLHDLSAARTI